MNNYGLTAERMMDSFPLALQKDPKMVALAHSIAKVLEQRLDEIDLGQIYTRIDQLPENLLDILAEDFAVDWYDSTYSIEAKRKTIKDSWYVHRHRGTKAAVEKAISAVYQDAEVLEWYNYNGLPYHFKLKIFLGSANLNTASHLQLRRKIICYKNLRSHLDGISYCADSMPAKFYAATTTTGLSMSYSVNVGRVEPTAHGTVYAACPRGAMCLRAETRLPKI